MKGRILVALAMAVCVGGAAMARIPLDEAALGGITTGMSINTVIQIYGEPKIFEPARFVPGADCYAQSAGYGDTVKLYLINDTLEGEYAVSHVYVNANNGFSTPAGIHVGSTKQDIINAYGYPDFTLRNSTDMWYKSDNDVDLVFHMHGNKVESISMGWNS